ncbi:unnamed protein product, partial [Leptidea sinapis]
DGVTGDKYKAALEYGKWCVVPAWVVQSAERGVALPFSQFRVAGASTSSPLPEHRLPDMKVWKGKERPYSSDDIEEIGENDWMVKEKDKVWKRLEEPFI